MPGCSIINYKDKEILYFDHRGLREEELIKNFIESTKMINEYQKTHSEILTLTNFTDTYATREALDYLKSVESKEAVTKCTKVAVIGITGIKKMFLQTYNKIMGNKAKLFKSEEEASEYLIS
ncbi:MAG: hypothetical protein JW969_01315 [Spirochaetales bacterium]|nr:hypothetical protein [Spirochaetales bacterium]